MMQFIHLGKIDPERAAPPTPRTVGDDTADVLDRAAELMITDSNELRENALATSGESAEIWQELCDRCTRDALVLRTLAPMYRARASTRPGA